MSDIILFAQTLDSSQNSVLTYNGEVLNMEEAQRAMLRTSHVSLNGKMIINKNGFTVYINDNYFTIEIPTNSKDEDGREAPILLYANINDDEKSILKYLDDFLKMIDRQINKEALQDILFVIKSDNPINLKYIMGLLVIAIVIYLITT